MYPQLPKQRTPYHYRPDIGLLSPAINQKLSQGFSRYEDPNYTLDQLGDHLKHEGQRCHDWKGVKLRRSMSFK